MTDQEKQDRIRELDILIEVARAAARRHVSEGWVKFGSIIRDYRMEQLRLLEEVKHDN